MRGFVPLNDLGERCGSLLKQMPYLEWWSCWDGLLAIIRGGSCHSKSPSKIGKAQK